MRKLSTIVGARSGLNSTTTLNGVSLSTCILRKALGRLEIDTARPRAGSTLVALLTTAALDLEEVRRGGDGVGVFAAGGREGALLLDTGALALATGGLALKAVFDPMAPLLWRN